MMNPTAIVDLSHPLVEPVPCYPGDPGFKMSISCSFPLITTHSALSSSTTNESDRPDSLIVRVHALSLGTHTGTHIDAPFHFFPSGQKLHEIPPAQFVGRAIILDVRHLARDQGRIDWADLAGTGSTAAALTHIGPRADGKVDIVLLWTGWDTHWGTPTYYAHPYFSRDVAVALRDLGARVVGVDVLNPDATPSGEENGETEDGWGVHETLLGHGVLICENLRGLGELSGGHGEEETWVSLMPLSIHGADGAPVRAYGWKQPAAAR